MEFSLKTRTPENETIIKELVSEWTNKLKDNPGTIILNEKILTLLRITEERIKSSCRTQIEEFEKCAKVEAKGNEIKITKIAGKEKEADKAIENLEKCRYPYSIFFLEFNNLNFFSQMTLSTQMDICFDECDSKKDEDIKQCYTKCVDMTSRYTHKATSDLLKAAADDAINGLVNLKL